MGNISRRDIGVLMLGAAAMTAAPSWAGEPEGWRLGFQTPPEELDSELTLVHGRMPAGLEGVLYRAGPGQFERAGERIGHWFDGDGMIQRFAIAGGRVRHRGRFVATDKRRTEAQAGRFLYSGYGFAPQNGIGFSRPDELNAANTNVLPMGEEVWALWEGGSPWRLDGRSLTSIGRQSFADGLDGLAFSAHPKRGPDGDIWNFGGFGSRCVIWRLDSAGAVVSAAPIGLPASTFMHDFAVTRRRIVLLAPPMRERQAGAPAQSLVDRFAWRADEPLHVIVLDKNDLAQRRIYELPAKFLFHIGNAWEDAAGAIRVDACLFDDPSFATRAARDLPLGRFVEAPEARPTMITLSADGRSSLTAMAGAAEFPRVDPRRVGERCRYTYSIIGAGLARWDWRSGRNQRFDYGPDYWAEEAVFVPRRADGGETDGWLVATRLNMRAQRTELAVFDARDLSDGPLAVLACPYVVPLGFHGAFAGAT